MTLKKLRIRERVMKQWVVLGALLFSTAVLADDIKQKEVIAQKLVEVDGTEQGLEATDKLILNQIKMRLPKDIPAARKSYRLHSHSINLQKGKPGPRKPVKLAVKWRITPLKMRVSHSTPPCSSMWKTQQLNS
jgi:hypothetical protein